MGKKKILVVSKCCESPVHMIPAVPSLGSPTVCYCSKCSKECELKMLENKK